MKINRPIVNWSEPDARPGWNVTFTNLGAKSRTEVSDFSVAQGLEEEFEIFLTRFRSQVQVAETFNIDNNSIEADDVRFMYSLGIKYLQRGICPYLGPEAESLVLEQLETDRIVLNRDSLLHAVEPRVTVDSSYSLDSTYELPLWTKLNETFAPASRYFIPQPSLEALAGLHDGHRRGDFLFYSPANFENPVLIEIDGSQHKKRRAVDEERDKLIQSSKLTVLRLDAESTKGLLDDFAGEISEGKLHPELPVLKRAGMISGNTGELERKRLMLQNISPRFAFALLRHLAGGSYEPGGAVQIDFRTTYEVSPQLILSSLATLCLIEDLWSLDVLPSTVGFGSAWFAKTGAGYKQSGNIPDSYARISVVIDFDTPTWAPYETTSAPACVIRNAFLPVDLPFCNSVATSKRFLEIDKKRGTEILEQILLDVYGLKSFRENQADAILSSLAGNDTLVLLPTGTGKSLIYQLVGLLHPGVTIVVDPIKALMDDQVRTLELQGLSRGAAVHSGAQVNRNESKVAYRNLETGQALFAFISPERLQVKTFREAMGEVATQILVNTVVLDEAHCISEWGHDFRTAYLKVAYNLRRIFADDMQVSPTVLALTGTASPSVLRDMYREIKDPVRDLVTIRPVSFDRKNLHYKVVTGTPDTKLNRLSQLLLETIPQNLGVERETMLKLQGAETKSGIIFSPTVRGIGGVDDLMDSVIGKVLTENSEPVRNIVAKYHGQLTIAEQVENADRFINNKCAILVSTKAFGMGIDKPNIRWTIHYGFPSSIEAFAQESGRSGRDLQETCCVIVSSPTESSLASQLLDVKLDHEERRVISGQLGKTDLSTQMYFHNKSFRGAANEIDCAKLLARVLLTAGPTAEIGIPRSDFHKYFRLDLGDRKLPTISVEDTDRAIYRLSMLGLIDDFTVNYGSNEIVIYTSNYSLRPELIDDATFDFLMRLQPGKRLQHIEAIERAPSEFSKKVEYLLDLLVTKLYGTIEPARLRAITEMHSLCSEDRDDHAVRSRVLAYLAEGPLALTLEEIAQSDDLKIDEAIANIEASGVAASDEWIGSSVRQLESFPDHPILLACRLIGESLSAQPDFESMKVNSESLFVAMPEYGLDSNDAKLIFDWMTENYSISRRNVSTEIGFLAEAWHASKVNTDPLIAWENEVLSKSTGDESWHQQIDAIRLRRIRANVSNLEMVLTHLYR